jgi:integrase
MGVVELFNRPAPQPTMVLVQPQPGGLPYGPAPPALRWQTGPALPFDASPPTLLPQPAALPRELNRDEVAALISAADEDSRLVALLLLSGVSPDEVLALRANDVDLARGLLNVGGVSARTVILADELRALLAARVEASPSEFLLGQQDRPATRDAMTAQILCAAHDASIERAIEVTPDCLRHTYLAFLVRQGIRFAELTRIVGHLPADTLGAYGALSPAGARVAGGSINVVFPAFPLRASG